MKFWIIRVLTPYAAFRFMGSCGRTSLEDQSDGRRTTYERRKTMESSASGITSRYARERWQVAAARNGVAHVESSYPEGRRPCESVRPRRHGDYCLWL